MRLREEKTGLKGMRFSNEKKVEFKQMGSKTNVDACRRYIYAERLQSLDEIDLFEKVLLLFSCEEKLLDLSSIENVEGIVDRINSIESELKLLQNNMIQAGNKLINDRKLQVTSYAERFFMMFIQK